MRPYCARVLATLVLCSLAYERGANAQSDQPPAAEERPPQPQPAPRPAYPPPYGYQAPPPGYGYYPPPPGYYYQQPPANLPYHEGMQIPPGYRHEKRPRTGLIIAGAVITAVPYVLGLSVASASKFSNSGGFLVIPALGPWITLAARDNHTCYDYNYNGTTTVSDSVSCSEDAVVVTFLVMDALIQTTGAILFVVGVSSDRDVLIRQDLAKLHLTPLKLNHGYGFGIRGGF
jgi:hypothetical protein